MRIKVYFLTQESLETINKKLNIKLFDNYSYFNIQTKEFKIQPPQKEKEEFIENLWKDTKLPKYIWGEEKDYFAKIDIDFGTLSLLQLSELFEQNISDNTQYIKYPKIQGTFINSYIKSNKTNEYPIYIPTKGRWDSCKTAEFLTAINAKFFLIVEEQEYKLYNKYYPKERILILPKCFQENYEVLDNYGRTKSIGPGASRNFAWEDSIKRGYNFHWVFDDNIPYFYVYNKNSYYLLGDTGALTIPERMIKSYNNIGICSINYEKFVARRSKNPPYVKNTRMYSMLLIRNSLPIRWRGRYNEDTILSLDLLTQGISTLQFNFIQGKKMTTQTLKGGNSEEFYFKEGTLPKSMMIYNEYPNYTNLIYKYKRWHHQINYKQFLFNPGDKTEEFYKDYDFKYEIFTYGKKTLKVPQLAEILESKDYKLLNYENEEIERIQSKEQYTQGYFFRSPRQKVFIYGIIPKVENLREILDSEVDYINLVTQQNCEELAKFCFDTTNMYDVQVLNEAVELAEKIIVFCPADAKKFLKSNKEVEIKESFKKISILDDF